MARVSNIELMFPGVVDRIMGEYQMQPSGQRKNYVVVLRGVPGSGKTILAKFLDIVASVQSCTVTTCSADHFFEGTYGYEFDINQLHQAHFECQAKFRSALQRGVNIIIVDNTNIRQFEYGAYAEHLPENYEAKIVNFTCDTLDQAEDLASRSPHDVPQDVIVRRFQEYQDEDRILHGRHTPIDVTPIWNTWDSYA